MLACAFSHAAHPYLCLLDHVDLALERERRRRRRRRLRIDRPCPLERLQRRRLLPRDAQLLGLGTQVDGALLQLRHAPLHRRNGQLQLGRLLRLGRRTGLDVAGHRVGALACRARHARRRRGQEPTERAEATWVRGAGLDGGDARLSQVAVHERVVAGVEKGAGPFEHVDRVADAVNLLRTGARTRASPNQPKRGRGTPACWRSHLALHRAPCGRARAPPDRDCDYARRAPPLLALAGLANGEAVHAEGAREGESGARDHGRDGRSGRGNCRVGPDLCHARLHAPNQQVRGRRGGRPAPGGALGARLGGRGPARHAAAVCL